MNGNQKPRIRIEPKRKNTDGKGAALLMQSYGVTLDEWQQMVIDAWLGTDETGQYTTVSAGLSVPRQNGKNVIVEARELYGLAINGEHILHTAHQLKTARASFRRLENIFTDRSHPELVKLVKSVRHGFGEEAIELTNGGVIEFISRTRQTARGYAGISLVVFDEAQEVTDEHIAAIMSTLSASSTGTRQIIYIGTPPYIGCVGEVFKRYRNACILAAGNKDIGKGCWHEWSIAADSLDEIDIKDKTLWYACNPSLGSRLTEEFTLEEFKTLSPDSFARERLGWWAKPAEARLDLAIDAKLWESCKSDEEKPEPYKQAYGVKFTADGSEVVLAGVAIPKQGKTRISLIAVEPTGRGLSWLADWLNQRYMQGSCVVIDGRNSADVLIEKLRPTNGVWIMKDSIIKPSAQNVITAANMLVNDITEGNITWYSKQDLLNESAITATKRKISGGGWGFGGALSAPIEACSLALWGCRLVKRNPLRKFRIG